MNAAEPWRSLLEEWAAIDDLAFIAAVRVADLTELRRVMASPTLGMQLWRRIAVRRAIERAELRRTQCVDE